jgi:hypothetical protein
LNFRTYGGQTEVILGARLGMYYNDTTGTAYFDDLRLEKLSVAPASYRQLSPPGDTGGGGGSTESSGGLKPGHLIFLLAGLLLLAAGYLYLRITVAGEQSK